MKKKKWEMPKRGSASGMGKALAIGTGISVALTLGLSALFAALMDRQALPQEMTRNIGDGDPGGFCSGWCMELYQIGGQPVNGRLSAAGWMLHPASICGDCLFLWRQVPGNSRDGSFDFWCMCSRRDCRRRGRAEEKACAQKVPDQLI